MSAPVLALSTTNGQVDLMGCWKVAHAKKSEALHCACPRCVHLDDVPHDDAARAARGIVRATIDGGTTKDVYRPPKGARLYLASTTRADGAGRVLCAECHAASLDADRAEWWRACLRELGFDADAGVAVDCRRVPAMERLNDSLHEEAAQLAELAEVDTDDPRAPSGERDDAERKEALKRRHADALVAIKVAASKAVDKANAETLLARYRAGCTIDPEGKEEDESVDVGDEDGDEAVELHAKCKGDVNAIRAKFPRHAEKWYGRAPTEEDVETQARLVETLASEADAAKDAFEALRSEIGEMEKQLVEDLEEEAFDDADAPKRGRTKAKRKHVGDMALDEAVAHEERRRRNAETRRKSGEKRRAMLEEYPKLKTIADKCGAAQEKLEATTRKYQASETSNRELRAQLEAVQTKLDAANEKLERDKLSYKNFKKASISFFDEPKGKPPGWRADDMFALYRTHIKACKGADNETGKRNAKDA